MLNDQNLHDENMNMLTSPPGDGRELYEAEGMTGAAYAEPDLGVRESNSGETAGEGTGFSEYAVKAEKELLEYHAEAVNTEKGSFGYTEEDADPAGEPSENAEEDVNVVSEGTVEAVGLPLGNHAAEAAKTSSEKSKGEERTRSRRFRRQEKGQPEALPDQLSESEQGRPAGDQDMAAEPRKEAEEKRVYAGFFVRLCAYLLDRLILLIPLSILRLILWFAASGMGIDFLKREVFFRFTPADMILYAAVAVYFIGVTYVTGRTIGKRIMRITVISNEDRKPSFLEILYRETIGRFLSSVIFCIGYLLIIVSDKKEALHDYLADTRVVYY